MDPNDLIEALSRPDSFVVYCGPAHSHSFTPGMAYEREKTEAEVFADALCPEDVEQHVHMASHTHGFVGAMKDEQRVLNQALSVHLSSMVIKL